MTCIVYWMRRLPIRLSGSKPTPLLVHRPIQSRSPEQSRRTKLDLVSHHVVARSCQLVPQRFDCQRVVTPLRLSLNKPLRQGVKSTSEIGGLHKSPSQIAIPILGIVLC